MHHSKPSSLRTFLAGSFLAALVAGCTTDLGYHKVVTHTRDGQLTDISEKTPAGTYRVVFNADGTVREDKTGLWSDGRRERGLGQDEVNALIQKSGFQFDR